MEHDYIAKRELTEDVDACLPSPMRHENSEASDDENSFVDEQNDKVEREENEELEKIKNEIPINEKAYLTHEEALVNVLEKGLIPKDSLNNWNNEDLTGVLVQLAKNSTDEDGVKMIARNFKDTSHEEIMDCINLCKTINKFAEQGRFRLEELSKPEIEISNQIPNIYPNWISLIERMKKLRGIGDQSANVISSYLNECNEEAGTSQPGSPNYKRIYECLSQMVKGYSMKTARLLDEAVILDIFEEIEREIDTRPDITRFFRKTFRDAQYLTDADFKLDELTEDNLANILNILNFPADKIQFAP